MWASLYKITERVFLTSEAEDVTPEGTQEKRKLDSKCGNETTHHSVKSVTTGENKIAQT